MVTELSSAPQAMHYDKPLELCVKYLQQYKSGPRLYIHFGSNVKFRLSRDVKQDAPHYIDEVIM